MTIEYSITDIEKFRGYIKPTNSFLYRHNKNIHEFNQKYYEELKKASTSYVRLCETFTFAPLLKSLDKYFFDKAITRKYALQWNLIHAPVVEFIEMSFVVPTYKKAYTQIPIND